MTKKTYEALAEAFVAEGVDTQFGLMGDGNMYWMSAMMAQPGMKTIGARHEHCSVLMAIGYWNATGKVGVASVTHGPGFTQIMTSLVTAARNNVPLVIFVGETALNAPWGLQQMELAPLAVACGAEYISAHAPSLLYKNVRDAFFRAKTARKPVVLGIPLDLQKAPLTLTGPYRPSSEFMAATKPLPPDQSQIDEIAERLVKAKCPVLVAGRGAWQSGATKDIEALAEHLGALLGTSLLGKGAFDHNPYSLGIMGGYIRDASREAALACDVAVVFGAQLSRFTLDGGKMFQSAHVAQIDIEPRGYLEALKVADTFLQADAALSARALLAKVKTLGKSAASVRSPELAKKLRETPADSTPYKIPDGTLDPRLVIDELERVIPKNYHFVSGSAHQAYWHTTMRGAPPQNYHAIRAFGAIGNAMSFATGVAVARGDGRVVLFEGDGGFLMHIQELETLQRQKIKALYIIINDGAFGAEIHKLRVDGVAGVLDAGGVFGRPGFESIAKAFGIRGATVTDLKQFKGLLEEYERGDSAMIWDVHVSDQVMAPNMRDEVAALRKNS